MSEIVVYDNYMNQLNFNKFTSTDFNMLMALCSKERNQGTSQMTFTFDELMEITNYQRTSTMQFVEDISRMNKKLMEITCDIKLEKERIQFVLFPTFHTKYDQRTLTVTVNEKFAFILNELTKNFTKFELREFVKLESKYSKTLYRLLKQFKSTGYYRVEVEDFRNKMGIPKSYANRDVMEKVIKSSMKELEKNFKNLHCEPIHSKRRGSPVIGYEFYFDKEEKSKSAIPQKETIKTVSKNKFNDFEQNDYDFKKLEEDLVGQMDIYDYPEICPDNIQKNEK